MSSSKFSRLRGVVREIRDMYSEMQRTKGGAVARLTLDLPQDLISEIEKRAAKNGQSILNFIREELELRYILRLPERKRGDTSDLREIYDYSLKRYRVLVYACPGCRGSIDNVF